MRLLLAAVSINGLTNSFIRILLCIVIRIYGIFVNVMRMCNDFEGNLELGINGLMKNAPITETFLN